MIPTLWMSQRNRKARSCPLKLQPSRMFRWSNGRQAEERVHDIASRYPVAKLVESSIKLEVFKRGPTKPDLSTDDFKATDLSLECVAYLFLHAKQDE